MLSLLITSMLSLGRGGARATPAQRMRALERPPARASPRASGARPKESMLVMSKESMLVMSKESMLVMSKDFLTENGVVFFTENAIPRDRAGPGPKNK